MHESLFPLKDTQGEIEIVRVLLPPSLSLPYLLTSIAPASLVPSVWALVFTENAHPTGQTQLTRQPFHLEKRGLQILLLPVAGKEEKERQER